MARLKGENFTGVVGNVILYTVKGENYMRAKPGRRKRKRGEPANPLLTIFGTVSKYGSAMIKGASFYLRFSLGRDTYNRARGWMRDQYAEHMNDDTWNLELKHNAICHLNAGTDYRDLLRKDITVSDEGGGRVSIDIPAIDPMRDLKTPPHNRRVNIKIMVITSPFKITGFPFHVIKEEYSFDQHNGIIPAKKISIDTVTPNGIPQGHIAIVVIALEFDATGNGQYNKEDRWLPAAVIAMGRIKG